MPRFQDELHLALSQKKPIACRTVTIHDGFADYDDVEHLHAAIMLAAAKREKILIVYGANIKTQKAVMVDGEENIVKSAAENSKEYLRLPELLKDISSKLGYDASDYVAEINFDTFVENSHLIKTETLYLISPLSATATFPKVLKAQVNAGLPSFECDFIYTQGSPKDSSTYNMDLHAKAFLAARQKLDISTIKYAPQAECSGQQKEINPKTGKVTLTNKALCLTKTIFNSMSDYFKMLVVCNALRNIFSRFPAGIMAKFNGLGLVHPKIGTGANLIQTKALCDVTGINFDDIRPSQNHMRMATKYVDACLVVLNDKKKDEKTTSLRDEIIVNVAKMTAVQEKIFGNIYKENSSLITGIQPTPESIQAVKGLEKSIDTFTTLIGRCETFPGKIIPPLYDLLALLAGEIDRSTEIDLSFEQILQLNREKLAEVAGLIISGTQTNLTSAFASVFHEAPIKSESRPPQKKMRQEKEFTLFQAAENTNGGGAAKSPAAEEEAEEATQKTPQGQ